MVIRHNELTAEEFIECWESVWGEGPSPEQTELAMRNSVFRVSVYEDGRIVAMARMIGDLGLDYYIKDVIVRPEYQRRGIGKILIRELLDFIDRNGVPGTEIFVELCAMPDKIPFYEQFGFSANEAQRLRIMRPVPGKTDAAGNRQDGLSVREVTDRDEKSRVARLVLEALQEWFEVPETREAYIRESADLPFFAAYDQERPAGFICLRETGRDTAEICVMGVLKGYHRCGVGTKLFEALKQHARRNGYSFLQVKTVRMGMYEDYDRTNRFYQSLGFRELEVFPLYWDEANPCQVYIMAI